MQAKLVFLPFFYLIFIATLFYLLLLLILNCSAIDGVDGGGDQRSNKVFNRRYMYMVFVVGNDDDADHVFVIMTRLAQRFNRYC